MASPLIEASPESVRLLAALRSKRAEQERDRLANVDAFKELGYEPTCLPRKAAIDAGTVPVPEPCGQCPQELFHAATEDDVLYGGAAGGGKTIGLVMEALRAAVKYPGIRVLMLRRSYDELAESLYPEFQRVGWGAAVGGRWNKTDKQITFTHGSVIRLRYLEGLEDASRRQGGAYQYLLVDERTLMPPGTVDVIARERLRSAHGLPVLGIRSTSNPGGASHGEVRAAYVDATDHGRKVLTDEHGLTRRFIPAKATDNPYLDAAYFSRLDSIKDPARRAAMRDGDWGQFAGQMFPEFRWDRHVIEPTTLAADWRRYCGVDWGYAAPWAVVWAAVDEDGRVWMYREVYQTNVGEADQAKRIIAAEGDGEEVAVRYADDAMWATRGDAKPIAQVYAEQGCHLTPAGKGPGSRVQGWQRWHSYLAEGPACPHHRAQGWDTCPMVHIFSTLPNLLAELQNLPHATTGDPEDAASSAPDHAMDASRYLLLNLGGGPRMVILDDPKPSLLDGIEVLADAGTYGIRPHDADDLFTGRDHVGTMQRSPFA